MVQFPALRPHVGFHAQGINDGQSAARQQNAAAALGEASQRSKMHSSIEYGVSDGIALVMPYHVEIGEIP